MTPRALRSHQRILLDSSVWIHHLEHHAELGAPAGRVIEGVEEGAYRGVSSELTLLELTVRPLQLRRQDVADEYELLLNHFANLELAPISRGILLNAAAVRARCRIRTPEAILLASAVYPRATAAVTNDDAWLDTAPAGIEIILLSRLR